LRVCIAMLLTLLAVARAAAAENPLPGLWGSERTFGPYARGTLTLDLRNEPFVASIAGYTAPIRRSGAELAFELPGGQGEFRGSIGSDGSVRGAWIQPETRTGGSRYATPVRLGAIARNVWRGEVKPLEDRMSLYVWIGDRAGQLRAFVRNPERNVGMGHGYTVAISGSSVTLANPDDASDTIAAHYDAKADELAMTIPGFGPFVFTRRTRDTAVGFYPRTPDAPYAYRQPVVENDGWHTASLAQAGLDAAPLRALAGGILQTKTDWYNAPYIQGILIARHGKLAFEEYFYGFDGDRTHDMRSASKSITSVLAGIAIDKGAAFSMNSPVLPLFRYPSVANPDPRKSRITVGALLSMQSGLACDDNDDNSPGNEDRMYAQTQQLDYYKFALDLPMAAEPNSGAAVYCTSGINTVGGVIRNSTGSSLVDFFARNFAQPLDIASYHLNLSPNGDAYMGGGAYLRPRDALKLGQLYLSHGTWNGRRVVSARWVQLSTQRHSTFAATNYASAHGYGYGWHLFTAHVGNRSYAEYMAQGNGGQLIVAIPDLDMTVEFTAGNYNNFPTWRAFYEELIPRYVIPAAVDAR
jgi:CubicO group peptidase (beta-lactamase class C family)